MLIWYMSRFLLVQLYSTTSSQNLGLQIKKSLSRKCTRRQHYLLLLLLIAIHILCLIVNPQLLHRVKISFSGVQIWRNVDSVVDPTQIRDIRLVEDSRMVQRNRYARPTFMILALITAIFNLSSKAGPWAEQKELLTSVAIMARLIP